MASKKTDLARIGGFFAFVALFISGTIFVVAKIIGLFDGNFDAGIFSRVASFCLLVSVIISGFIFLESRKWKNKLLWTILFWVFVILAILGFIL